MALIATALALRDATFSYDGRDVAVHADLAFAPQSFTAIVGPSGSGKTTVLRALARQIRPRSGQVVIDASVRIGYVPQVETIDWNFPITVTEVALLGRAAESGPWPWSRPHERAACETVLARLGLGDLGRRPVRSLSGGQQQRVFLARALMRQPDVLLLDEPTSGVDVRTRQEILDLLGELHLAGLTVIVATHDINGVAAALPDVVCLNRRVLAHGPPDAVFTHDVLRATFGTDMVVFRHDGMLLTADAPPHGPSHDHHVHVHHGPEHTDPADRAGGEQP